MKQSIAGHYHYVSALDMKKNPPEHLEVYLFPTKTQAEKCLARILDGYGVPLEVWKALHAVMAEEALTTLRDGVFFSIGEIFIEE